LVTLEHVAGPDGARLVPDLALALPHPAADGRAYTFRLRPGLRYSTGAPVRASDVTHTFERLFRIGSSGATRFAAIDGAGRCLRHRTSCTLTRGVAADDRRNTVTFHLSRPDPDFLYKLTLAYAMVLPAAAPAREARAPLPATGPYRIVRYRPEHELLLARNPSFREWSAAAQPDGYPDRIDIRLDLTGPQGTTAVSRGRADFVPNIGALEGAVAAPARVKVNPFMLTDFLFLNLRVPPFTDVRARRALNYALDRRQVVADYGGPGAARPTCQLLPPGVPGYRPYCPYTAHPGGRWRAPDLARARRLVAASHTTGMKVVVWDTAVPKALLAEGRETVAALNRIGYRASLRLLASSTFTNYTNDSRNRVQVIDGGWSADYPTADDIIGRLTCAAYVPANGPATTDPGGLCDRRLDRQIGNAAALQTTDPTAAAAAWARLDRQLTDRAVWLPTVVPHATDLLSHRIGHYRYNPIWGALLDQMWVR
jgi:peptide/nickel transport system substrate-binding protein